MRDKLFFDTSVLIYAVGRTIHGRQLLDN